MTPYYYIHCIGGTAPKVRHATLAEAEAEAIRLSMRQPQDTFEILQCVGITKVFSPQTFWMDGVTPPHVCQMNRLMDGTCGICQKHISTP